jgi:protein-tyrosine phosphatase
MTVDADVAERLIPLEGGVNFRDMGGYPAADGRRVKWRSLYRSGTMGRLTPGDYDILADRGIRTIIDLRTGVEQQDDPNLWAVQAGIGYWSRDHDETFGNLHEMAGQGIATAEEAHEIMMAGYRHLPVQHGPAYAEMFRRIAAGLVPIVINCTAGKDRTGAGAALVLAALGVPRETIAADFHMTERAVDLRKALAGRPRSRHADRYLTLAEPVMRALGRAHPDYIRAMLEGLDAQWGGIEGYVEYLGLTHDDLQAIRNELLD